MPRARSPWFLLAVAASLTAACPPVEPPEVLGAETPISVMSFNIRYDNPDDGDNRWDLRSDACAEMLAERAPDVVGVQEALHHQVLELEEELPEYDWLGVGRDDGVEAGEFAPVFYRADTFELADSGTFWLSETPEEPSVGWDAALERIVTWVELDRLDADEAVFVFNTHFDHQGSEARRMSAALLADEVIEIAGDDTTAFATGDFNAWPTAPMFEPLLEVLYDARATAPLTDDVLSYNGWGGGFPGNIDYVLFRGAEIDRFETVDDDYGVPYISDHYPIVAELRY